VIVVRGQGACGGLSWSEPRGGKKWEEEQICKHGSFNLNAWKEGGGRVAAGRRILEDWGPVSQEIACRDLCQKRTKLACYILGGLRKDDVPEGECTK